MESKTAEYRGLVAACRSGQAIPDDGQLAAQLVQEHDWTPRGAEALLSLAHNYGAFMLRNALALAEALEIEDGDLNF